MKNLKPITKTLYKQIPSYDWQGVKATLLSDQMNLGGEQILKGSEVIIQGKSLKENSSKVSLNSGQFNIKSIEGTYIYHVPFDQLALCDTQNHKSITISLDNTLHMKLALKFIAELKKSVKLNITLLSGENAMITIHESQQTVDRMITYIENNS